MDPLRLKRGLPHPAIKMPQLLLRHPLVPISKAGPQTKAPREGALVISIRRNDFCIAAKMCYFRMFTICAKIRSMSRLNPRDPTSMKETSGQEKRQAWT